MNPKLKNKMTMGSTFNPGLSSVYSRSMVPLDPPAPAALVLLGLAFFTLSLWSAAARRRMAERGPPGGEAARATDVEVPVFAVLGLDDSGPDSGPDVRGEAGRRLPVMAPKACVRRCTPGRGAVQNGDGLTYRSCPRQLSEDISQM